MRPFRPIVVALIEAMSALKEKIDKEYSEISFDGITIKNGNNDRHSLNFIYNNNQIAEFDQNGNLIRVNVSVEIDKYLERKFKIDKTQEQKTTRSHRISNPPYRSYYRPRLA